MFSAEDIQSRLRQQPFQPLRIIATEGLRFDIYHPDLVLVGRHDIMIGSPSSKNQSVYDHVTRVALVHIVAHGRTTHHIVREERPGVAFSQTGNRPIPLRA